MEMEPAMLTKSIMRYIGEMGKKGPIGDLDMSLNGIMFALGIAIDLASLPVIFPLTYIGAIVNGLINLLQKKGFFLY